jgi:magnesium-protoporphyrin O-methyltransferase
MNCCCCQPIDAEFNEKYVARELKKIHKKGPAKTTNMLLAALKSEDTTNTTLIDIGGGIGTIIIELLNAGVRKAFYVDTSIAYTNAAKREMQVNGCAEKVQFSHGDFVLWAKNIPAVDIVTLDRVICCYEDMKTLVELSSQHAEKYYGVVYPRNLWWVRIAFGGFNIFQKILKRKFRTYVHSSKKIEDIVLGNGFTQYFCENSGMWQVVVYRR